MEQLREQLKKAGLTGNEARVYLELLKHEELTANEVSKRISIDRTLAYNVISHLIEKGLISYIIKENKKFFKPEKPENLLSPLKEKEFFVKNLILELKKIKKENSSDYEIKIYEGKEGLRNLIKLILKHKEIGCFGGTGRAYDLLYEVQAELLNLKEKEIHGRIIFSEKYRNHKIKNFSKIEVKYLASESEATTTIFGDFVSIHLAKEKPLIILIKSKDISRSYLNYFEELWRFSKA